MRIWGGIHHHQDKSNTARPSVRGLLWGYGAVFTLIMMELKQHRQSPCTWFIMRIWGGIHNHQELNQHCLSPLCLVFYEDLRQYSHSSRWNYISTARTLEYGLLWGSGALFTHIIMKLKQHALLELCIWFIKRIWGGINNHLQPGVSTILYTRTVQYSSSTATTVFILRLALWCFIVNRGWRA